jgi:SAM-dependent methyltransferase
LDQKLSHEVGVRDCCPSCFSTLTEPLLRHPFDQPPVRDYLVAHYEGRADMKRLAGTNFEVNRCLRCGLVFQRNVPSGSLLNDLYECWISKAQAAERHRRGYTLREHRYIAGQVEFVLQHFDLPPWQLDVLDFGFGWAEWARVAYSYGCNVWGAELSKDRVAYARSIGIMVIDQNEIANHQFHFINTEQVFEHLIQPRGVLEHLVKALHPKGIIKISVPDGRGVAASLKRFRQLSHWPDDQLMPIAPLEHVNCFNYPSLVALGRLVGLQPLRPRLRLLYNGTSGWFELREAARNLFRPIYRHVYPKSTFVYFSKAG